MLLHSWLTLKAYQYIYRIVLGSGHCLTKRMHNALYILASVCACENNYMHLFVYIYIIISLLISIFIFVFISINEKKRKNVVSLKRTAYSDILVIFANKKYQWEVINLFLLFHRVNISKKFKRWAVKYFVLIVHSNYSQSASLRRFASMIWILWPI